MRFNALETFRSEEMRSTYMAGLSYTVRPGNDLLARHVAAWVSEGKVEVIPEDAMTERKARVSGHGVVT